MSEEDTLMDQTIKLAGIHPVRHKPTLVWAVEITKSNIAVVAEWINENDGVAAIQYDDDIPIIWIGSQLATIGDVIIRGTVGKFTAIDKQEYLNDFEDIPQTG